MITAAFALIAAGVLLFVFTPLFDARHAGTLDLISRKETRRRELIEQRDRVYEAIRELDFDHRMGKVEADDYRQTRGRYAAQAVELMKALDDADAESPDDPAESLDDQIEREIAAIRKKSSHKGRRER